MADILLKGGYITTDPRLDRIPQFDNRNLRYLSNRLEQSIERIEKYWDVTNNLDQGYEGACVGFGFAHEAVAEPNPNRWLTNKDARNLYWEAQKVDDWEGGSYPDADPFYEGTSVLAGAKVFKDRGFFDEYKWTYDVDELILAVGYDGPAVIGIEWYEGMIDTDWNGYVHVSGPSLGGHCILVNEVSPNNGYFGLWNSWGPSWGEMGRAKVSFDDMAKLMENTGEAVIPVRRGYVINPHER